MADVVPIRRQKSKSRDMRAAKGWAKHMLSMKEMGETLIDLGVVEVDDLQFQLTKMDAKSRKEVACKLSEKGLSTREIARITGAGLATIHRDLSVPNGTGKTTRELLSQSDQNDWRTPRKFLDAAREVMGGIDLDPATSKEANETVDATLIYTEDDDGLQQPWKGRVWLNPPYGGNARLFIERLMREYEVGNVTAACTLVNSHPTETKWFQQLFDHAICFVAGRIDFGGPSRAVSTTSTHGSAVAYLGKDREKFAKVFSQFGSVVVRLK